LAGSQQSTLARVAIAAAPEILRVAEQLANRRAQQRKPEVVPSARAVESIQLSEVVIDFTVPFVRKITMRNATAWSVAPHVGPPLVTVEQPDKRGTRMKRVGLVGISGAAALAAGLIAHYADQRIGGRGRIIDVTGRRRD
jgi:hypothetical protein